MKSTKSIRCLMSVIGALIVSTSARAGTTLVSGAERAEALQFVGAWRKDKDADSFILIYLSRDGQLVVRGQDQASIWGAQCSKAKPGQFTCEGTGEMLGSGKLFLFSSTMKIADGRIEDQWRADGRKEGKLDTASGTDQFVKMVVNR